VSAVSAPVVGLSAGAGGEQAEVSGGAGFGGSDGASAVSAPVVGLSAGAGGEQPEVSG